jgi:prevent-host-death family protein
MSATVLVASAGRCSDRPEGLDDVQRKSMMTPVGIRELKNNLSKYIERVEAGEGFVVTRRKRVRAELVPSSDALGEIGEGQRPLLSFRQLEVLVNLAAVILDRRMLELYERRERTPRANAVESGGDLAAVVLSPQVVEPEADGQRAATDSQTAKAKPALQ